MGIRGLGLARPHRGILLEIVLLACSLGCRAADSGTGGQLDEIVVTATLMATPDQTLPASVSVLDASTLRDAGQQNFEDVLALVPNLNWAGDTSLPRYFQIRGIGELEIGRAHV